MLSRCRANSLPFIETGGPELRRSVSDIACRYFFQQVNLATLCGVIRD
jgi:hypothetical protein